MVQKENQRQIRFFIGLSVLLIIGGIIDLFLLLKTESVAAH
jgi:hypothetical protein